MYSKCLQIVKLFVIKLIFVFLVTQIIHRVKENHYINCEEQIYLKCYNFKRSMEDVVKYSNFL